MIGPTIYADDDNLYLEWPTHALRFPFTEGGLSKALAFVPRYASLRAAPLGTSNLPTKQRLESHIAKRAPTPETLLRPKVAKATKHARETAKFSQESRSAMMELIRKHEEN